MVIDDVWRQAVAGYYRVLCIGCLEHMSTADG
jgi:hypothetical protein